MLPDTFIATHHPSTARLDPSQHTAWIQLTNTRTDYNSPAHGSRSDQHYDTFTASARYVTDNISESKQYIT